MHNHKKMFASVLLWMVSVMGIGLLGADNGGRILLPKAISVDSYGNEYGHAVICDGVRVPIRWWEAWASRVAASPHWVELQFGTQTVVRAVAIHWNVEKGTNWTSRQYAIQRWEAGAYTNILEVKDNPAAPYTLHTFDAVKTDRLRIWQPALGGPAQQTNVMWIAEIEVYDYARTAAEFGTDRDREQQRRFQAEVRARTIGIYKRCRHSQKSGGVEATLAPLGMTLIELDGLDERELRRCGVVVIAGLRYIPNPEAVINFVANGGGVLFLHNACGRSGGSLLPDIWEFQEMGRSDLVVKDKTHPVTKGLPERFTHAYADHACLKSGGDGKVLVADAEGRAVVIAGQLGKGKVIAMGAMPGQASGPNWENVKMKVPEGAEADVLKNSVRWLAEGTCLQEDWKDAPAAKAWRKKDQARKKQFTDVTEACGVAYYGYAKGVAMGDVDHDGDLDIYSTVDGEDNRFYRNDGKWRFTECARKAGIALPIDGIGCAFGDLNGDGNLDLFVCWLPEMGQDEGDRNFLYLGNGKGQFQDGTERAGLLTSGPTADCAFSDVDNDGDLDLYLINYAATNKLYLNSGDGVFTDVTSAWGLDGLGSAAGSGYGSLGSAMADLDGDGYQDLITFAGDAFKVLRNKAGKGFQDVTSQIGVSWKPVGSLGIALGDIDNDGDLDIYVSGPNKLLRNDGQMRFTDITAPAGFETFEKDIGPYGPIFVDYDNDGNLDLFLGTGAYDSIVYRNNGNGTFTDVTALIGLDVFAVHGCDFGDLDGDGDMDFYATAWTKHEFKLLRNNQDDSNYLKVQVKGRKTNSTGIGAKIWVYEEAAKDKGRVLKGYREIQGGGGAMYTCPPLEQHVGLPHAGRYSVEVLFPVSGKRVSLSNVSAAQTITVEEPE